jgi:hypothetical protein
MKLNAEDPLLLGFTFEAEFSLPFSVRSEDIARPKFKLSEITTEQCTVSESCFQLTLMNESTPSPGHHRLSPHKSQNKKIQETSRSNQPRNCPQRKILICNCHIIAANTHAPPKSNHSKTCCTKGPYLTLSIPQELSILKGMRNKWLTDGEGSCRPRLDVLKPLLLQLAPYEIRCKLKTKTPSLQSRPEFDA